MSGQGVDCGHDISLAEIRLAEIFSLAGETGLTPSCLQRGAGGDRDPKRLRKREAVPNATLSPPSAAMRNVLIFD